MSALSPQIQQTDTHPKRLAILSAALKRFAESGVNGVAVPDIASQAEVGTGTIYRYFQNKEALVNALFQEEKRRLKSFLTDDLPVGAEPRQQFDDFWRRMVAFAREHPASFRFLELQDHRPYLDETSRELEHQVLKRLATACRHLQNQGTFRSDIRAEVIMALVWGAYVNLMKAESGGHLTLADTDILAAGDACWRLCAVRTEDG